MSTGTSHGHAQLVVGQPGRALSLGGRAPCAPTGAFVGVFNLWVRNPAIRFFPESLKVFLMVLQRDAPPSLCGGGTVVGGRGVEGAQRRMGRASSTPKVNSL